MNNGLNIESLPFAAFIFDKKLKLLDANSKAFSLFNLKRIKENSVLINLNEQIKNVLSLNEEIHNGKNYLLKEGDNYKFKLNINKNRSFEGYLTQYENRYLLSLYEVTETEKFIEIYRESKNYLENIVNSISAGILVLNSELKITSLNKSQEQLFQAIGTNITLFDAIGVLLTQILPAKLKNRILKINQQVLSTGIEATIQELKTNNLTLKLFIFPLKDGSGNIKGTIQITEDITNQKRLEEKLLEAEKLAAIGSMIVTVNHEINNPLTSVLGNVQLLLKSQSKFSRDVLKKLKKIEENTLQIADITHKLEKLERIKEIPYDSFNTKMIDING